MFVSKKKKSILGIPLTEATDSWCLGMFVLQLATGKSLLSNNQNTDKNAQRKGKN